MSTHTFGASWVRLGADAKLHAGSLKLPIAWMEVNCEAAAPAFTAATSTSVAG